MKVSDCSTYKDWQQETLLSLKVLRVCLCETEQLSAADMTRQRRPSATRWRSFVRYVGGWLNSDWQTRQAMLCFTRLLTGNTEEGNGWFWARSTASVYHSCESQCRSGIVFSQDIRGHLSSLFQCTEGQKVKSYLASVLSYTWQLVQVRLCHCWWWWWFEKLCLPALTARNSQERANDMPW